MADPDIQRQIMEVLSDPMNLPSTFWDYMVKRWLRDAPVFPISQVFGLTQFTVIPGTFISAQQTTTSSAFGDLATVGPTITGAPDGKYVVFHGCEAVTSTTGGFPARMSVDVNSGGASQNDECFTAGVEFVSIMRVTTQTLSNSNSNTITARYSVDGGGTRTATFGKRWLFALKYQNL